MPFGTEVHSLINERDRGKFEPKTEPAFILGFTDRPNTYRVCLANGCEIKSTCDVIFRGHGKQINAGKGQEGFTEIDTDPTSRPIDDFFNDLQTRVCRDCTTPENLNQDSSDE